MIPSKSLEHSITVFAALLQDVSNALGEVFNTRSLRLTAKAARRLLLAYDMDFLTKILPTLGKALDKGLVEGRVTRASWQFKGDKVSKPYRPRLLRGTELPQFCGELFIRIFEPNGCLRKQPCVRSVKMLRHICFLFYKYRLPYAEVTELQVLSEFEKTEAELSTITVPKLHDLQSRYGDTLATDRRHTWLNRQVRPSSVDIVREARILLSRVFAYFDPLNIHPRHGPGAVATKQKLSDKYRWTNVAAKITELYPFDAYFTASLGSVCDNYPTFSTLGEKSLPAKVVLVPKDSRGPRLISCEPVDYQWVQQGLGEAIVELVESHPLTREVVHFTDQEPNRNVALIGSYDGRYSTLDLKEASDRVSLDLVRLLFPEHICAYLEACRSGSTELPDGRILKLEKFAPMGSALCFPIMALTIWAILTAAAPNAHVREHMLVYGDDVIVPTAYAADAIEYLESFGLRINRDKSCTSGLFRESCGRDAFQGVDVTPVKLKTVWSESPSAEVYSSWIAYANSFWDRQMYCTYNAIVDGVREETPLFRYTKTVVKGLLDLYPGIPSEDMTMSCPSLRYLTEDQKPRVWRWNKHLQKREFHVRILRSPSVSQTIDGWSMLLRFFAESSDLSPLSGRDIEDVNIQGTSTFELKEPFSVRLYTRPRTSMLGWGWRGQ